jgi:alpha-galactosidase
MTVATIDKAPSKGHSEHIKTAAQLVLPGEMSRPIKVTLMGAGSFFTQRLVNDILSIQGAERGEFALVDVDQERLATMHRIVELVLQKLGKTGWSVKSSANRREVMAGSHYIINCIEVSGTACVRLDNDIPLKYGVSQCIGDTIGPGGLFKGLRTIPVFLQVLRDAEELCPDALVLNYTNPMSMLMLAAGRASPMRAVGLCHSVQGTSHLLAKRAGIAYHEMEWECAGINHLAWFTKLEHQGKSLYPKLMELARKDQAAGKATQEGDSADLVRKDMMLHFGAFITESSGHLSEYLPYYRTRQEVMEKYCRAGYEGAAGFYSNNWPTWRKNADGERMKMLNGEKDPVSPRSWEYASWIIEAREKDAPYRIHGNVMNTLGGAGPLISNLPHDGCVEVSCLIDRNGINPTRYGKLPPQMAGICDANMRMFDLAATAAIERSKEAAIHALMLDPLTAARCSPAEIKQMTLELFEAEQDFLPGFR